MILVAVPPVGVKVSWGFVFLQASHYFLQAVEFIWVSSCFRRGVYQKTTVFIVPSRLAQITRYKFYTYLAGMIQGY